MAEITDAQWWELVGQQDDSHTDRDITVVGKDGCTVRVTMVIDKATETFKAEGWVHYPNGEINEHATIEGATNDDPEDVWQWVLAEDGGTWGVLGDVIEQLEVELADPPTPVDDLIEKLDYFVYEFEAHKLLDMILALPEVDAVATKALCPISEELGDVYAMYGPIRVVTVDGLVVTRGYMSGSDWKFLGGTWDDVLTGAEIKRITAAKAGK